MKKLTHNSSEVPDFQFYWLILNMATVKVILFNDEVVEELTASIFKNNFNL